jgi:hypothetical protein
MCPNSYLYPISAHKISPGNNSPLNCLTCTSTIDE